VIGSATGALCGALAVVIVLAALRRPLLLVLAELCRGDDRARFWWRVVTIEVTSGTALCASLAMLLPGQANGWRSAALVVQGSAAGLLVSLALVMVAVLAFQRERDREPAAVTQPRRG
jgi:hypothetical protein